MGNTSWAMDNAEESKVVGKIVMASAPMGDVRPASTLWWDGIVLLKIFQMQKQTAFKVAMEGLDTEMVTANNDDAVWLITGFNQVQVQLELQQQQLMEPHLTHRQ